VEVSLVRRRVQGAITAARQRAQLHRQATADAGRAYAVFLEQIAAPVARQVAGALKAEGFTFTVFTPGDGVRLASDRGRDDYIELALDIDGDKPQVIGRTSYSRGSRTIAEERPIKAGAAPDTLTEEDVLDYLVSALEPWLER
jgi:hypothetical protein